MVLRSKQVKVGERDITMRELSALSTIRLGTLGRPHTFEDLIKEMVSKEDVEYLDQLPKNVSLKEFMDAFTELSVDSSPLSPSLTSTN